MAEHAATDPERQPLLQDVEQGGVGVRASDASSFAPTKQVQYQSPAGECGVDSADPTSTQASNIFKQGFDKTFVKIQRLAEAASPWVNAAWPQLTPTSLHTMQEDVMTYRTQSLSSVVALFISHGTVWRRPALLRMGGALFLLSLVAALFVLFLVSDPAALKVSKFAKISGFLNVFVGLLLGFFMSSSMTRWYNGATGFLELFDAVRHLQMSLYSLGVSERKTDEVLRYGVLSGWLLALEMQLQHLPEEDTVVVTEEVWKGLSEGRESDDFYGVMRPEEAVTLRSVADPAGVIWVWIALALGRLAQDGDIPPMASPVYARMMSLQQEGFNGIRSVRSSITIQPPFIYVQMLASLVHVNNFINAISFGMTWGSSLGTSLQYLRQVDFSHHATLTEVLADMQNLVVSFFLSACGPFIYLALFEVSIAIAQPFGSKDGEIPIGRLISQLTQDLYDGKRMLRGLPEVWPKPSFKTSEA